MLKYFKNDKKGNPSELAIYLGSSVLTLLVCNNDRGIEASPQNISESVDDMTRLRAMSTLVKCTR